MRMAALILIGLLSLASAIAAKDDPRKLLDNRKELEKIKADLNQTQRQVDSLKKLENNLLKSISKYGERVSRNRKVVDKLERQLVSVQRDLAANNSRLNDSSDRLKRRKTGYTSLLVDYYRTRWAVDTASPSATDDILAHGRRMQYLAAITGVSAREIGLASDSVRLLTQYLDSLTKAGTGLQRLRKEKKTKVSLDLALQEKGESSLGTVRRQANLVQERLASLSDAARRMEDIIAGLEKKHAQLGSRKAAPRLGVGAFDRLQGQLVPPIRGEIVSSFGWKTDKLTNLKSFSPGIDIKPSAKAQQVVACAPGRVAYVGSLRGYDNFVILEHDDGYYSTYANLSSTLVELDNRVATGQKLGLKGRGSVHFELRLAREHLDPVIWLDIDAF